MRLSAVWTPLVAAILLAACGGGSHPIVDDRVVPASATASPAAFTAFVGTLAPDDTAEPLIVEDLQPPVTDEEEPLPVN